MWLMYIIACIPVIIGAILWYISDKIVWWEWIVGTVLAFITVFIFHICLVNGMTSDVEIWSGCVKAVEHTPYWHARWEELETYTVVVGSGKNMRTETRTRLVTKTKSYPPTWTVDTTLGKRSISEGEYKRLYKLFGEQQKKKGSRLHMDSGDPYDYYLVNKNNHFEPVHFEKSWENRVKACPSVFSYPKIEADVGYNYPEVNNIFKSARLFGKASKDFNLYDFDCMNARLGPNKKVNVIIIGFGDESSSQIAHDQEAKWIGGKKNDLVICYGGTDNSKWCYVFGWTEEALVKRNLETLFITNEINNDLLSKIENEISENYIIRDWHQFDYLTIEPPTWSYFVLIGIMIVTQTGFILFSIFNPFDKDNSGLNVIFK